MKKHDAEITLNCARLETIQGKSSQFPEYGNRVRARAKEGAKHP